MAAVCSIKYIDKTYKTEDASYVASLHMDVESTFMSKAKGLVKRAPKEFQHFRLQNNRTETYAKTIPIVRQINEFYGGNVVYVKKDSRGKHYFTVNVNSIAPRRLWFKRDAEEKQNNDPYIVVDGEVGNRADYDYQKRIKHVSEIDDEKLQNLSRRAKYYEDKFKEAGVNVTVIYDSSVDAAGQVLGKNNSKRKELIDDGSIPEDGHVIAINPKYFTADTISHEFGHIFIDLIGGINNGRINAAYSKLVGSSVYKNVKELYPDLAVDSEMFKKEVVAEALGQQAEDIFAGKDNRNWWSRFKSWVNSNIAKVFNTTEDTINSLAYDLINFTSDKISEDKVSEKTYSKRTTNTNKKRSITKEASTIIDSIDKANRLIYNDIKKIITDYERRTGEKLTDDISIADLTAGRVTERDRLYSLKQIMFKYKDIVDGQQDKYLIEFISEISSSAIAQAEFLQNTYDNMDKNKNFNPVAKMRLLNRVKTYMDMFSIADRLSKNINVMNLDNETKATIKEYLKGASSAKNDIFNSYKDIARLVLVETNADHFDYIRTEYKEQYGKYYNLNKDKVDSDIRSGESKDEYVKRKMNENAEEITIKTKEYLNAQLLESLDIGQIEMYIRSEVAINSTSITLLSQLLDKADYKRNQMFMPYRTKAFELFSQFNREQGKVDPGKMYETMIDETENGLYLTGEYKAEFYEKVKELSNAVVNAKQKYGDASKEWKSAYQARTKFLKANTISQQTDKGYIYVPTNKWKNPNYAKLMSDKNSAQYKLYEFFKEINEQADKNTRGLKSLNRNVPKVNVTWYALPSMGKDTLEKVTDGQYKDNVLDTVDRWRRYKEDEGEIGEKNEIDDDRFSSDHFRRIARSGRASLSGEERYLVPILFRDNMPKARRTKDLTTLYMMNLFSSQNFMTKSEIHGEMELLLDVSKVKNSLVGAGTNNFLKLANLNANDIISIEKAEGVSNEYKKMLSIAQNRMYGKKTIETEFGKYAETIMAWTGTTMLALNFYSGMANLLQGKTMNFFEAVGKEFFKAKDLKVAEAKFFGDMGAWINDIGSLDNESRTMLLLDVMDPQGDFRGIKDRYNRSNKIKSLASRSSLSFPNKMGETYVQATLMYAIMNNIKVLDKDGNYLDKDFRPTKDKSKAISVDEAIEFKDGSGVLNDAVYNTTHSDTANGDKDVIMLETKNLVKYITADLHGQYDPELQSMLQRTVVGKMIFMLRKWVVPGVDRRYRGLIHAFGSNWRDFDDTLPTEDNRQERYYSQNTKSFREGTYTTFVRFVRQLLKEGEALTLSYGSTNTWKKMTDHEKANVRKWATEFVTIILTVVSAWILRGLADDLPEDEATLLYLSAFGMRRLHQELVAYANPVEALQLMRSPAATISMLENAMQLAGRTLYDGTNVLLLGNEAETYQTGKRKGDLKIAKEFKDVFPVLSQTNRNLEDVTEYVFKAY